MENGVWKHIEEIAGVSNWRVIYFGSDSKDVRKIERALYVPDLHVVGINPDNWPLSGGNVIDDISPSDGRYWRLAVPENEAPRATELIQKFLRGDNG